MAEPARAEPLVTLSGVGLSLGGRVILDGVDLVAGMPVQVTIKTGERSLFDYLSRPLVTSFNRAFHEP